jgi:hypothetical protein
MFNSSPLATGFFPLGKYCDAQNKSQIMVPDYGVILYFILVLSVEMRYFWLQQLSCFRMRPAFCTDFNGKHSIGRNNRNI